MELDVEALYQAAYGERSEDRIHSRNGYPDRAYKTRAGEVDLKIPSCVAAAIFQAFSSRHFAPHELAPRCSVVSTKAMATHALYWTMSRRSSAKLIRLIDAAIKDVLKIRSLIDPTVNGFRAKRSRPCRSSEKRSRKTGNRSRPPAGAA
jgi:hypothetical protein